MTDPNPALSPATNRRLKAGGIFQAVIGILLLLLMGTVTWRMAPMLLAAPATMADGSHFKGSPGAARLVLALFGSLLLFGAASTASGLIQAATGARPRRMLYLLWAAGALCLIMVLLVVFAIKQAQP